MREPGARPRQHARIVLDARAEADLLKHLDVVPGTLRDALRLDQLSVFLEVSDALLQLLFKILDGLLELFLRRDIVARRENFVMWLSSPSGTPVSGLMRLMRSTSSPKNSDAHHILIRVYRPDLDRVAAHAEAVALEGDVVALLLDVDQTADERVAAEAPCPDAAK